MMRMRDAAQALAGSHGHITRLSRGVLRSRRRQVGYVPGHIPGTERRTSDLHRRGRTRAIAGAGRQRSDADAKHTGADEAAATDFVGPHSPLLARPPTGKKAGLM